MSSTDTGLRVGMDVYDTHGRYIGMILRSYPVSEPYRRGDRAFGCFKVRRGPLPFAGPPALLVPFDAIRQVDPERFAVTINRTREEAGQWATGRQL